MAVSGASTPTNTVSFAGKANNTGSATALFLSLYAGEVLTAFEQANVTYDKHIIKSIPHGVSTRFPLVVNIMAYYFSNCWNLLTLRAKTISSKAFCY
jgi:hypothetical protein